MIIASVGLIKKRSRRAAKDPKSLHAWAEDCRAGWTIDRELDEQDRGRKLDMPLLMLWGAAR
ncbi:hypothetical protein GCM10010520_68240 [Rhizobium viscosum]|uniref:Uncharacterized protein n=1 Tax=Rhizobium viscosum TaxID=1673 RepID=A0ABR9IU79_RHIVS|nr:hypothetical protein [Rhizobium viscosum]MBE1506665.1 hypothetical protein [Rhizobium viscosum]